MHDLLHARTLIACTPILSPQWTKQDHTNWSVFFPEVNLVDESCSYSRLKVHHFGGRPGCL